MDSADLFLVRSIDLGTDPAATDQGISCQQRKFEIQK